MRRRPPQGEILPWSPRPDRRGDQDRYPGPAASGDPGPAGAPPDKTGAEEHFYRKHMLRRTPVVVVTTAGEELRGWIEWYDRDVVKLHSLTEPNRFLAKSEIKYILKHAESGDPRPVPTPPPLTGGPRPGRPRGPFRRPR